MQVSIYELGRRHAQELRRGILSKESIAHLYLEERCSIESIAGRASTSVYTVFRILKEYGIQTRKQGTRANPLEAPPKELIEHRYWIENKGLAEIAKEFEVNHTTIWRLMKSYGIPRRKSGQPKGSKCPRGKERHPTVSAITKGFLHTEYIENEKSAPEIAEELGCSKEIVWRWLHRYGIPMRNVMETLITPRATQRRNNALSGCWAGSPNSYERRLLRLIQLIYAGVKFTGDKSFWLRIDNKRFNPDYTVEPLNSTKKLIELAGRRWHTESEMEDRVRAFKRLGYECLVIWGDELKDASAIQSKVRSFIFSDATVFTTSYEESS